MHQIEGGQAILDKDLSSANIVIFDCTKSGKSLTYKMNINGPRTDPCGTPQMICFSSDLQEPI